MKMLVDFIEKKKKYKVVFEENNKLHICTGLVFDYDSNGIIIEDRYDGNTYIAFSIIKKINQII